MNCLTIARRAFEKHAATHPLTHYTGILSLHGLARLAVSSGEAELLALVREQLGPFVRGERRFKANFTNYHCGGNATAWLLHQGLLPEAADIVRHFADELLAEAPRDADGIFSMPGRPDRVWIDVAFAVTPFLLYAGLALGEERYVAEAVEQTRQMVELFRDPACGLLHQCRGFRGPGRLSEDHWSRGNGWGLLALTELVQGLPADHPARPVAERLFIDLTTACLAVQDDRGLWHQELTIPESYVETSGTGLILYGLGVGLESGLLPHAGDAFARGLQGYLDFLTDDGSVFHTCRGCLCPGDGTILDYMARAPVRNDPHAFGPVVLAFGQALRLGLTEVNRCRCS